jgi:hypothetical protein
LSQLLGHVDAATGDLDLAGVTDLVLEQKLVGSTVKYTEAHLVHIQVQHGQDSIRVPLIGLVVLLPRIRLLLLSQLLGHVDAATGDLDLAGVTDLVLEQKLVGSSICGEQQPTKVSQKSPRLYILFGERDAPRRPHPTSTPRRATSTSPA